MGDLRVIEGAMEMDGTRHGVGELEGEDANGTVAGGGEVIESD